jgi:L,D-transpeptidase ErfK/SrfK
MARVARRLLDLSFKRDCEMSLRTGWAAGWIAVLAAAVVPESSAVAARSGVPAIMTGGRFAYTTVSGDSLTIVGARYGVEPRVIATLNDLSPTARLRVGQTLTIDNRHLIPEPFPAPITINIPQRLLFLVDAAGSVVAYPIGLGRPSWPTFIGPFRVALLEVNPVWDVPPSIQEELRRLGKPVVTKVLPGPDNPLGQYWIGLDRTGYGIHGTNAPASIYHFQTHGCIRLHPDDIARLFGRVSVGTRGEIVYRPILLARADDGTVWLEAHSDVYHRSRDGLAVVRELASYEELEAEMDWMAVRAALQTRQGTPIDVTRRTMPAGTRSR